MGVEKMENEGYDLDASLAEVEYAADIDFSDSNKELLVSGGAGSLGELIDTNNPNKINMEQLKILLGEDFSQQLLTKNTHIEVEGINFYIKTADGNTIATLSDTNPGIAFSLEFAPQTIQKPKPEGRDSIVQHFNSTEAYKDKESMFNILNNNLGLSLNFADKHDKKNLVENLKIVIERDNTITIREDFVDKEGTIEEGRPLYTIRDSGGKTLDIIKPSIPIIIPFKKG